MRPSHLHSAFFFFFNDTATTEIYTLSLHDALPISVGGTVGADAAERTVGGLGLGRLVAARATGVITAWTTGVVAARSARIVTAGGAGGGPGAGAVGKGHTSNPHTPTTPLPSSSFKKKISK